MVAALIFSLQFKPVQTYVAKKTAKYLSNELNTTVDLNSLYIKPFKSLVLEGLYIEDLQNDTLLYSSKLSVDINLFSISRKKISINTIQVDNGKIYVKQYKDSGTNLSFIINYFNPKKAPPKQKKEPFDVSFERIVLNNMALKYRNFKSDAIVKGINFNDVSLKNLNTAIEDLDIKNHLFKADFKNLSFREKSGFYLKNLSTRATIDTNQMEFDNLLLQTQKTLLTDYLLLRYDRFADFNKFITNVYMKLRLNGSKLHTKDIAYFVPALNRLDADIKLDGTASGYVNDIKARNLMVQAGKTTYLKGNFNIRGLPDFKQAFLDLDFDQVYTNKKDADLIISKFTGKNKSLIPVIVEEFGNINFKGRFTGLLNDFIAYGEFKTRLGRIESDVNMKTNGSPTYKGIVKAYNFDLGDLINQKNIGRTTFTASLNGSGFNVNSLKEKIDAKISYFDLRGYRYQNIAVNGTLNKKLFDGRLQINDRNLKLDFNGGVNLYPKLPEFNFTSTIRQANLKPLGFTKDTVQIDADFKTNFSGNNLDNIQGNVDLKSIRLTNTANSFVIDSVALAAVGTGKDRSLSIQSDIFDASIKGQYDLAALPSYFKSVVKKYIPSLQVDIKDLKPQNFEFNLQIREFEPVSLLFIPKLKIPGQATFNGRFVSAENIATLNGFAKLVAYNNIKINDLIIDQTTTPDALNLFITSDRVDLTDSLYVKNVNIANILRNDSLYLNVKLSDKTANNQLDLNSLVEFSTKTDSLARLSILPSDLIINKEIWKIQEKVNIRFDEGKTYIKGFELFRDNQMLTVNGILSADPEDELKIGFNKFKLTTFNPLTQALGINLKGQLNGDFSLASATKIPRIESSLQIDSLNFNNTPIGDLKLDADLDNATKLVNVKTSIRYLGSETLDIEGTYNANSDQENLDMEVTMRDNEIIIFEPFLKKLVSNLRGKVSAKLKVTGPVLSPRINGELSLKKAGMTVNYLKTPYRITDNLTVENSVIKLDDLVLTDIKNNKAVANGSVDMRSPKTPDIQITISAKNFMALNTTARDNPVYYGTAYGTGTFRFNGPTNNMRIDIDAKTEAGTIFNIPLNSSETVGENDFINFVAKDSSLTVKKQSSFSGLTMNFDLVVDENSQVNIFTDLGQLSGRGDATLNLKITSLGDFEMFGDYLISQGEFEFTVQDFINKIFEISRGGSIRWTGDATEALINLRAVYAVRTSLRPLYTAAGRPPVEQRVLAEALMNLNGLLLKPDISFDINFPADAYVKDELQTYFTDENNTNQQALSLIVRRSFAPGTGTDLGQEINSAFLSAGTELAFNQLNNILSQTLNLNFVDLNIRSLNEASASFRFLNDRLILTGGVTDRRSEINDFNVIGNSVARDVEALYLLRKDGSLVLRASNRLNNRNFLSLGSNDEYISAIGLVYRQDFDTLTEYLKILLGQKRREERRRQQEQIQKPNAVIPEDSEGYE